MLLEAKKAKIDLEFRLKTPYSKIRGVGSTESFLDALMVAHSDSDGSRVLFSNTQVPLQLDRYGMRELFRARSSFERFNSIREFEARHGQSIAPIVLEEDREGRGTPVSFTQSALVPAEVGGFHHFAFVQPFSSPYFESDSLVLVGVVGESTFNKLKYSIPFNWVSNALLLLILGVLSLNFFRLKLLRNRGVIYRSDAILGAFSMMGIASLFVVFLVHLVGSQQFNRMFDGDLETFHETITREFDAEVRENALTILKTGVQHYAAGQLFKCPKHFLANAKDGVVIASDETPARVACPSDGVSGINTVFVLDRDGSQVGFYASTQKKVPKLGFSVSSRDYYRAHKLDETWAMFLHEPSGSSLKYYMERIESKAAGELQTAISVPLGVKDQIAVGLMMLQSLESVVLPPGMGFAVFDSLTGEVLFHSDAKRSLRENFYRATDDDPMLKAAVVSGMRGDLTLNYKGETVDAIAAPLRFTDWTIVTFHRDSLVDVVNFHFGINALILAGGYIVIWLILLPLAIVGLLLFLKNAFRVKEHSEKHQLVAPQFLFPQVDKLRAYRRLAALQLLLVAIYLLMLYGLDLPGARWWILFNLVAAPLAWYLMLNGWRKPWDVMGSLSHQSYDCDQLQDVCKDRENEVVSAWGYYRFNSVLLILLVAVLPTMMLHNENYDIHERLWVEFYNWSVADRLQARNEGYREYQRRMVEPATGKAGMSWRGIYLPRTIMYRLKKGADPCKGVESYREVLDTLLPRDIDSLANPPSREQTLHIQVMELAELPALSRCHVILESDGSALIHERRPKPLREQSRYMRGLVGWLPNIDDTGTLIESFVEMDTVGPMEGRTGTLANTDEIADMRINSVHHDPEHGLVYLFHSYFPHTRQAMFGTLVVYAMLAIVSGMLISVLQGFLMRRFFSRYFDEELPRIMCRYNPVELQKQGAIVVVPAGMRNAEAFERLVETAGLEDEPRAEAAELQHVCIFEEKRTVVVEDFVALIQDREQSRRLLELLDVYRKPAYRLIILTCIDIEHWLYHRKFSEGTSEEEKAQWECLLANLDSYILPIPENAVGSCDDFAPYLLPGDAYRRSWDLCSEDEQMVLAGLRYEQVVNPRNRYTLTALLRRRLIEFRNGHFEFGDPDWCDYVGGRMSRAAFRARAQRYKNKLWLAFRGPMLLALLVLVIFIAVVAQDEMKIVFSLLGSVGAGAATLMTLHTRLREYTGNA